MRRLPRTPYLHFPLRIGASGALTSDRRAHVREQIVQVLATLPGERVFRPEFGAGVQSLTFEPNTTSLWELAHKRISAALAEALQGEVDPRTLELSCSGGETQAGAGSEVLRIQIRYELAALGEREEHSITVSATGEIGG